MNWKYSGKESDANSDKIYRLKFGFQVFCTERNDIVFFTIGYILFNPSEMARSRISIVPFGTPRTLSSSVLVGTEHHQSTGISEVE